MVKIQINRSGLGAEHGESRSRRTEPPEFCCLAWQEAAPRCCGCDRAGGCCPPVPPGNFSSPEPEGRRGRIYVPISTGGCWCAGARPCTERHVGKVKVTPCAPRRTSGCSCSSLTLLQNAKTKRRQLNLCQVHGNVFLCLLKTPPE